MWYVIHTRTGAENELVQNLEAVLDPDSYRSFLVPMFEDVTRSGGVSRIGCRRIFPGYVLVDTDTPADILYGRYKLRINVFSKLLGTEGEGDDRIFCPISGEDADFLESVLENGIMTVSYVELEKGTKIKKIIGPLAKYGNHISKIELRRRRAIVDAFIFGKQRRIKFGLWTDMDPEIPWIKEALKKKDKPEFLLAEYDIGIHPGDMVREVTGTYSDMVFEVEKVNILKRTIRTKIDLLGEKRTFEIPVDQVEKVQPGSDHP